eukprot:111197-Amphidinium_carterae.1
MEMRIDTQVQAFVREFEDCNANSGLKSTETQGHNSRFLSEANTLKPFYRSEAAPQVQMGPVRPSDYALSQ